MSGARASLAVWPAAALAALVGCGESSGPSQGAGAPVLVEVARAEPRKVDLTISAAGTIEPRESVWVSSGIAGTIRSVNFEEGQSLQFKPGQAPVLFRLDTSILDIEVQGAQRQVQAAVAEADEAQARYDRVKMLYEGKAASKAEFDEAKFALDRTRAAQTRALGSVQGERRRVGQGIIRAPFPGVVGERLVGPGELVQAGQRLVEVLDVAQVKVAFAVASTHLPRLRAGMPVSVIIPAAGGAPRTGQLTFISPRVDETRTVHLHALLDNGDGALRPGMAARVEVVVSEDVDALVIPEAAVENRGEKQLVYRVEGDQAHAREVVLLRRLPGEAVISGGLAPGDSVVVRGLDRMGDGARVRVKEAVAPGPSGAAAPAPPPPRAASAAGAGAASDAAAAN